MHVWKQRLPYGLFLSAPGPSVLIAVLAQFARPPFSPSGRVHHFGKTFGATNCHCASPLFCGGSRGNRTEELKGVKSSLLASLYVISLHDTNGSFGMMADVSEGQSWTGSWTQFSQSVNSGAVNKKVKLMDCPQKVLSGFGIIL